MLKSKFLDIVKTFSPEELKGFRNFVRSPFHNSNKNVIRVTEIVKKYFPEFKDEHLLKENIFMKIYPGKMYNDTVMRILLSDLLKLAEEYLACINLKKNPLEEKKLLLNELDERRIQVLFNMNMKSANEMLGENNQESLRNDSFNSIDIKYFLDRFEFESLLIDNMISRNKQPESGMNVLKQGEYLINFFLINILNIAQELSSHYEVLNVKFEYNIVDEFLSGFDIKKFITSLEKNNYRYYSVLSIYYYMYMSLIDPDKEEYFYKLKDLIFKNLNLFKREEKFNLFIILESICTSNTGSGKRDFYKQLMIVYEEMLSKNIYTHSPNEHFQVNLFRNIFYTAIALKKFDWAEDFINKHLSEVMPEYRDEVRHLAYTLIYFEKKDYARALEEISGVRYDFFVFKYDIRILTLKIYYEMNSFESALSLIDTFTHFLTNSKSTSESYKEGFFNFLKYVRQFIRIKTGSDKIYIGQIKKEILATAKLINKNWILEKAEELIKENY